MDVQGLQGAVVDKLVEMGIGYLSKNPEQNLAKLLDLGERLARKPEHRQMIAHFTSLLAERPSLREYVRRVLTEVHPNYCKKFLLNLIVHASLLGIPRQQEMGAQLGVNVPYTILIDPTEACNLRCNGCWAGKYEVHTLPYPVLKRILDEARELGIHFIVLSGGEPFAYPHLIHMAQEYPDIAFMLYTNGTLIDEEMADQMQAVGNLSPAISLEGWRHTTDARRGPGVFDRVMQAMDLLKERGVIFGFSVTVTRHNAAEVFSDEFMDFMVEKGALYGWSFHYIPVGRDPDLDLLLEPEQRLWLAERVVQIRETKPLMVMDFWNDGELTQGCIAGGRRYFHITA
ncbi:MAG: radical SAM protein, partial [Desulfitobacteriaceae bacterium]|nr:radical SAM protein [Desulfitobacteriaceae bacterium]